MKRKYIGWIVGTVLMCLLSASATVAVIHHRRTVPFDQCSAVYQRYAHRDGIKAVFFPNKAIPDANDTSGKSYHEIDMTVLMTHDSLTFATLLKEWGRSDEYVAYLMSRSDEPDFRFVGVRPKGFPERVADTAMANNDVMVIFPCQKAAVFFHTTSKEEVDTFVKAIYIKQDNN